MADKLTTTMLSTVGCKDKSYKLFDGGGLYLLVSPSGSKYWRLKYRFQGKEKSLSFGGYPEVSLALAREKRAQARKLLAQGIDPSEARKAEKAARKADPLGRGSETSSLAVSLDGDSLVLRKGELIIQFDKAEARSLRDLLVKLFREE